MSDTPSEPLDDLSTLSWVQEELKRSLEAAHKALRRYVKESEAASGSDIDAVDPAILRTAQQQIHQGVGALELIGLPAVAGVLRASESAVKRFVQKPQKMTSTDVDTIEQSSFALLDYLQRLLAGKPMSALALFPRYQAVQVIAGADRVHPADLWAFDWRWREIASEPGVVPHQADVESRTAMEQLMLQLMRGQTVPAATRMSDVCACLGAGATTQSVATLWKLAAGFFESQALGLIQADVFSKRVGSRLLALLRILERGDNTNVSERLAQDLLFFCAQSQPPAGSAAPRLRAVREAYDLTDYQPVDYETNRLGRFDPSWIAQARKRVASAKDAWSGVAGGEMHRLGGLSEQFSLVGDSLKRLYPSGEVLAEELQQAIVQTQQSGAAPPTALAMEVATSVLYLESSLEDADFDHPEEAQRVRRLAQRVANVRSGHTPDPLEAWMEELYRRVSDRQTMGSVVQELRISLTEVEKQIDQFFRHPDKPEVLQPVPGQLSAMRGVLSVLGMAQAVQAVARMREDVEGLVMNAGDSALSIQTLTLDRLAGNLGALGFLIDMLGAQPHVAKSLFVFDPHSGALSPLMGRSAAARSATNLMVPQVPVVEPRLIEQAQALSVAASDQMPLDELSRDLERLSHEAHIADQPGLVATVSTAQAAIEQAVDIEEVQEAREQLSEALADFVSTASGPMGLDPLPVASPPPPPPPLVAGPTPQDTDLGDDPEMREIFLEEAREKVVEAREALELLVRTPDNIEQLTAVRRAFHTFKGSSRMVGLREFGDAAWACEQLYNTWLAEQESASPALLDFSNQALGHLDEWIEAIADQRAGQHRSTVLVDAAAAFGRGETVGIIGTADSAPVAAAPAVVAPVDDVALPLLSLDLPSDEPEEAAATMAGALADEEIDLPLELPQAEAFELPDVAFDLDLSEFDPIASEAQPVVAQAAPAAPEPEPVPAEEEEAIESSAPQALELPEPVVEEFAQDLAEEEEDVLPTPDEETVQAAQAVQEAEAEFAAEEEPTVGFEPDRVSQDEFLESLSAPILEEDAPPHEPMPVAAEATASVPEDEPALAEEDLPVAQPEVALAPESEETVAAALAIPDIDLSEEVAFQDRLPDMDISVTEPAAFTDDDQVKMVGPLRISIPLFNIYLNEADELSRKLTTEVAEWAMELFRPVGEMPIALAHSLAGSSATVGFADLSHLARLLEHALMRCQSIGTGTPEEGRLFVDASEEIRRLLHQFAAGFLMAPSPQLLERLAEHEISSARRLEEAAAAVDAPVAEEEDDFLRLADAPSDSSLPPLEVSADLPVQDTGLGDLPGQESLREAVANATHGAPTEPAELGMAEFKAFTPLASEPTISVPVRSAADAADDGSDDSDEDIDSVDAIDAELFEIFEEEAQELLPQLDSSLRDWARRPADNTPAASCMRTLHTLKGGARLAGAMRLGEMAHRLETAIEHILGQTAVTGSHDIERLQHRSDGLTAAFEVLRLGGAPVAADDEDTVAPAASARSVVPSAPAAGSKPQPVAPAAPQEIHPSALDASLVPVQSLAAVPTTVGPRTLTPARIAPTTPAQTPRHALADIDWSRFPADTAEPVAVAQHASSAANSAVRVRGPLLERMVNQAGEVSITRSRIEAEVGNIRSSLNDLTDNLERLRQQLRDIEFQAETQMLSRQEAAKAAQEVFDPLESDRFTRFQELTRMMAESVNDVATVQRTLQRTLETTEDELAAQARLTRDLQDDLLRTRMVEFESLSDRLYRVVRMAAKETGKHVRLDIIGGSIEIDRGVLDRMTPAFEHLLRNCVTHGIESPDTRTAAGKDGTGSIVVVLRQEGNEVGVEFRDDGGGLNLNRIRNRGVNMGLLQTDGSYSDAELANLIFTPGFSTAETVTELAGRGVGMDVVRSEVNAMGGRIETATATGQGTSFKLVLPLTTAVTQVVMLRCGSTVVAVPATLIEIVRRASNAEIDQCYLSGNYTLNDRSLLFFWFGSLLQQGPISQETGRTRTVVVVRSAQQRIALHVDEVLGTQEVVVKNLGPQLAKLPGLAGMTLLASGAVSLIYNPVALATLYGDAARAATQAARLAPTPLPSEPAAPEAGQRVAPLVLVVDDSLTVRRVTQRLLVREGFRVVLAKDGIEALERLAEDRPQVVLSDIEMPRMDGFDLARNIRGDARLRDLPIIMITSRIAQKHRDHAAELGVDHYLGKPYSEEDLLALIARYTMAAVVPE